MVEFGDRGRVKRRMILSDKIHKNAASEGR